MDFGKVTTCAHCGRQFKALLEKHDEQDCIDGLLAENARLREKTNLIADRLGAALREREEARAEVKRLEGLILDFDYWHSHQATAKEAPDELIVEARRIRAARSGSEGEPKP